MVVEWRIRKGGIMDKWLSISRLSEKTGIAETTVRRYTNKFINYFRYEKRSRGKKFHPGSVEILNRISSLYNDEYEAKEIEDMLVMDFPFNVECEEDTATQPPPVKSIERQFEEFKEQQGEFNNKLLQQLQKQQDYIKNSVEQRDQELLKAINEMRETRMSIAATKEKKWWKFWKFNK